MKSLETLGNDFIVDFVFMIFNLCFFFKVLDCMIV